MVDFYGRVCYVGTTIPSILKTGSTCGIEIIFYDNFILNNKIM